MKFIALLLALFTLSAFPSCSSSQSAPGHTGSAPSPLAQQHLRDLAGSTFTDLKNELGGGDWTVGPFGVIPNNASAGGKGPVVRLQNGLVSKYVPVECDADVADLVKRVSGQTLDDLEGDLSEAYATVWN